MTREGIHNQTLKKIEGMIGRAKMQIDKDLEGVRPFDKQPVTPKEQLFQFSQMTQEVAQQLRQSVGEEAWNNYVADMSDIARRHGRG